MSNIECHFNLASWIKKTKMYLKSKEDAFIEIMATCHKYCRLPGHSQTQMLMTESTAETSKKNIPDIEYYFNLPSCIHKIK